MHPDKIDKTGRAGYGVWMDKQSRREALRQYKEAIPSVGVFAVRCAATGQSWVGISKNLEQQQNRIWFGLRLGTYPNRDLVAAWKAHGPDAFAFEVLEVLDTRDATPLAIDLMLKDAYAQALARPNAAKLVG